MRTLQAKMPTNLVKTMVYMPPELREALEELAKKDNRSLSNLIVTLLQRAVQDEENTLGGSHEG